MTDNNEEWKTLEEVSGKGKGATLQEDEKMQRWQELDM
jgi:hypothetical protein